MKTTLAITRFEIDNDLDFEKADARRDKVPGVMEIHAAYEVYGIHGLATQQGPLPGPWDVLRRIADLLEAEAKGEFAPDKMT